MTRTRPDGPVRGAGAPTGPTCTVRPATQAELDDAGRLVAAAYRGDGLAHDEYLAELADAASRARDAAVLVAVDGADNLLGSVTFVVPPSASAELSRPGEAEVRMLAVSPAARGAGVGALLVTDCIDRARTCGARRLRLCTQPEMSAAQRVYERLGFVRDPSRDWSPVPGIDLLAYVLEL